ncbi:preprotein translocase subunit YajC [Streptomyces meridianus]|uniref:Preprotein translocase subunit YajC n=1 Tax=Streptomyces meridianus TaxID=2938945 RepID=A0ABT0XA93_9ACTN|nr:preprotein translocase subunit YajC [Streptomyces meridianus]MCM2579444.1 preprotein translocase subunit YajC [Streptomyces meridianus]
MDIVTLLPLVLIIGVMFLMTRSAKNKQRQAVQMRDSMQPGAGIRTIGGMYATVKEIHDDTILLEVAPGVHAVYAKNAVGAVLEDEEYNRIVHGIDPAVQKTDEPVVPDDASSLTDDADDAARIDLGKSEAGDQAAPAAGAEQTDAPKAADRAEDGKKDDGGTDAK